MKPSKVKHPELEVLFRKLAAKGLRSRGLTDNNSPEAAIAEMIAITKAKNELELIVIYAIGIFGSSLLSLLYWSVWASHL